MTRKTCLLTLAAILMSLLLINCLREETHNQCVNTCQLSGMRVFVTTSDFTIGSSATLSGTPPTSACIPCLWVSSDTAARAFGSKVYVVNRYGYDNIQVVDATNGFQTIQQFSVGHGGNPQDIAVVTSSKAYVSRLGNKSIWVGNPVTGKISAEINLSAYADADGIPEAAKMVVVNNRLFVALQRLDSSNWYVPTTKSSVAVIDTDTNAVKTIFDLTTKNPVTNLIYNVSDAKIYVGCAGAYQSFGNPTPDGGVETITVVDTATDTYTPNGLVIDENTLGGDVNALAVVSATQAYALVADASFANYLVRFNPTTGVKESTLLTTTAYIPDIALDGSGYLYLSDRDLHHPGVRVWDTATDTEIGGPISTGLPPNALAVMP